MQDCTHGLLVVAEKDCDACTAETHLRFLLVKILQQLKKKKIEQAFKQESHWCTTWCIPCTKNSLGCCLNHCTTTVHTSSDRNMGLWGLFFNSPTVWKLHGIHFILIAVCKLTDCSLMPCNGRCSNIWNIMRTFCHTIFVFLDHKESPQIHIRQWHVGGCDTVP